MPLALRARLAVAAILAVLLIPVTTSSLRGLTHVLTCKASIATPFTIEAPEDQPPVAQSSLVIQRGVGPRLLCGALTATISARGTGPGRADLELDLRNRSAHAWRGSVGVVLDGTTLPIRIGRVPAGRTRRETVTLHLRRGQTHELKGNLLIGP